MSPWDLQPLSENGNTENHCIKICTYCKLFEPRSNNTVSFVILMAAWEVLLVMV